MTKNFEHGYQTEFSEPPKCPQCGEPATFQSVMGQLFDANAHAWYPPKRTDSAAEPSHD